MRLPFLRGRARTAAKAVHRELVRREAARQQGRPLITLISKAGAEKRRQLGERIALVLRTLDRPAPDHGEQALCDALESALAEADGAQMWLALAVLTGRLPLDDEVVAARRRLRLGGVSAALVPFLATSRLTVNSWRPGTVEVLVGVVLVDVDHTAKNDTQTGIQRVVRQLLPRWQRDHEIRLAVWTDHGDALREPDGDERERVLQWERPLRRAATPTAPCVVVPWCSTLVVPEVPGIEQCSRLAALAKHSLNRVTAVVHDCIPVFSADLMPVVGEPNRFVRYLSLIKHTDALAGVSASAAQEFRAVTEALSAQGLTGPRVFACPLGREVPDAGAGPAPAAATDASEVLVVGSHEPRKNHLAVLHAAEVLWREGLRFRLRFIGAGGWTTADFDRRLDDLTRAGRDVGVERTLDDDELWAAYRRARFTVFASIHEGYGLPVVESLAFGTPVLGTAYGSVAEQADDGGMVLVDPRDDEALTEAMRSLLVDDERLGQLVSAARERPVRTWDDYACELWQRLVAESA